MRAQFKKAIIDDIISASIDLALQDELLDLFKSTMKNLACTLAREARFDTTDFATAKMRNCEGFALHMRRSFEDSRDAWTGTFERGQQRLDVDGHLEEYDG